MIKFRAWDRTRNEMNYSVMVGNCDTDDENYTCPTIWIEERKKWLHFDDYDSIMQSTGLKDKNVKEIFEKDILDYNGRKVIVKWHGSYACFIYEFVDELKNRTTEWQPLYLSYYKFEIIGNVYENPELMEVE